MADTEPDKPLQGYEVLLCVTGGIACYKSADLASKLVQAGAGVSVAMTDAAQRFVTPLTFQALSGRRTFTSMWESAEDYSAKHVSLTEKADLMIIAPATANTLAKLAGGLADELVAALALAATDACGILAAPAMNTRMLNAPATQENLEKLRARGVQTVGPGSGRLACGTVGPGRMAEPDEILQAAKELILKNPPKSKEAG